jgi:ABC-2 type transport system permease protein
VNSVRLIGAQARYSMVGFLRQPRSIIFALVMPICLLVIFNSVFRGRTLLNGYVVPVSAYFTASIIAFEMALSAFAATVMVVTAEREAGLLRRMRATPMPGWVYIAAEVVQAYVMVVVCGLLVLVAGSLLYGVGLSAEVLLAVGCYLAIGTAVFVCFGLAATCLCRSVDTASSVSLSVIVVLALISGVFIPQLTMPAWLVSVGKLFPMEWIAAGMQTALGLGRPGHISPSGFAVVAGWGVLGAVIGRIWFRWSPAASGAR